MTPSKPRVSVVMAVYRPHPDHFPAAVRSVLAQTLEDWELLIIEDPSDRSAAQLLQGIVDERIILVENPRRTSLVDQRNEGIERARASHVALLDADDLCEPNRLAAQLEFFESHPDVQVLGSHIRLIDGEGKTLGYRAYPETHEAILTEMRTQNPVANPAVMFVREAVLAAGAFQFREGRCQDYEMYCRLAREGLRFATHPDTLTQYRVHDEGGKSRDLRESLLNTIRIKKMYFTGQFTIREKLRLLGEQALLLLPPSLVLRLFLKWSIRRVRYADTGCSRPPGFTR